MIAPYIVDGDRFVACPTRLGSIKRRGPTTGQEHHITFKGVWIPDADAELMVGVEEDVWCFRQNGIISIITVFNMDPPELEIRRKGAK